MCHPVYHSVLLLLVALVACTAQKPAAPDSVDRPGPSCDRAMEWGGWDGSPECAAIAHSSIPAADLSCKGDQDCVLVGRSSCGANSVARRAQATYAGHAPACGHPAAGQCPPIEFVAECRRGCCGVGIAPTR